MACDAKTTVPSGNQVAPRAAPALAMVAGGPPESSMRFSLPSAKKPTDRLSGDQKGRSAPSVPGNRRASIESTGRVHNLVAPSETVTNAIMRPSGETAALRLPPNANSVPRGGLISKRRARPSGAGLSHSAASTAAIAANAAAAMANASSTEIWPAAMRSAIHENSRTVGHFFLLGRNAVTSRGSHVV